MAIATKTLVIFPTEEGDVSLTLLYDDVAMRATGVHCVNPSSFDAKFLITRDSDGKAITHTCVAGSDETMTIPTNVANRIDLSFNSRGGLNGYSFGCTYPA